MGSPLAPGGLLMLAMLRHPATWFAGLAGPGVHALDAIYKRLLEANDIFRWIPSVIWLAAPTTVSEPVSITCNVPTPVETGVPATKRLVPLISPVVAARTGMLAMVPGAAGVVKSIFDTLA